MNNVCDHVYLTRKCPHCENADLEAKLQATEAEAQRVKELVEAIRNIHVDENEVAELRAKLQAAEAEANAVRYALNCEGNPVTAIEALFAERDRLHAEVARLLDVGADAFHEVNTLHAAKDAMETDLIYVTSQMDEHPDGYEGPCWCRVCRSYATDDGEDGK